MSILEGLRRKLRNSGEDERDLTFHTSDELDFTLSDQKDVKITTKIDKLADVDIKYPLIKPFAYAHVKWDAEKKEVIYHVEEPSLDGEEQDMLAKIKENLSEKLDVSLSSMQDREKVIEFLEEKINELLLELGIEMTEKQHNKIMYYIYRDFVGLGGIEPFMHDPYIEDLGADGTGIPIFAVHSEFGSVKSDVVFDDQEELKNLVVKLAERCGKYVSYANPLLDGALPDGSRVNASLTEDVTSHGPTFSIRKFQETPFSAIDMLDLGTVSPEMMAYLWILMQYQQSVLICGGTATGKTSLLNSAVSFIPPEDKIVSIEDTRELQLPHENWIPSVTRSMFGTQSSSDVDMDQLLKESFRENPDYVIVGEVRGEEASVLFQGMASIPGDEEIMVLDDGHLKRKPIEELDEGYQVPTIDPETAEVEIRQGSSKIKHPERNKLLEITTRTGRKVEVTPDHSLFEFENDSIVESEAGGLSEGDRIVVPAKLPTGFQDTDRLNLVELLPDCRVYSPENVKKAVEKLSYREAGDICNVETITDYYGNHKSGDPSSLPSESFEKLMKEAEIEYSPENVKVTYERRSKKFPGELPVTDELLRLLGYYIAEGSLNDSGKNNTVALYSSDETIIDDMKHCIKEVTDTEPREDRSDTGYGKCTELSFAHKPFFEFLRKYCGYGSENKKVPGFVFGLSKQRIGEFLTALWNGDGSFRQEKFKYFTVSESLAQDVSQLLLGLGIIPRIKERDRKDRETTDYEIGFGRKEYQEKFLEYVEAIKTDPDLSQPGREDPYRKGDIYLDEIKNIREIEPENPEPVYDISVPGTQSFIGGFGGVMLHNSGHPSLGTMHASGPNDVVKRLVTPPISLSPALVESLDAIVVMTHAKGVEKSARRVRSIHEVQKVMGESQSARTNAAFSWTARDDSFSGRGEPYLFDQISTDFGITKKELQQELENRVKVMEWLRDKGVKEFERVSKVIAEYYKNKEEIIKMVNAESGEYSLEDVIRAEQQVDLSHPDRLDSAMDREQAENENEDLQSEIRKMENKEFDGNDRVEDKLEAEENPVEELEKRLRDERRKVEKIRGSVADENPFDGEDADIEADPFEA